MAFPEQAFEHGDIAAGFAIDESALSEEADPAAQSYYLDQVAEFFGRVGNERHPECPDGLALADSELLVPIQEVNRRYQQACEDPNFNGSIDAWWALWKTCFRVPEYIRNPLQVADKNGLIPGPI